MKRLLPVLLLSILLLGACGGGSNEATTTTTLEPSTTSPATTLAPSTTSRATTVPRSTTSRASSTAPRPTTTVPAAGTTQPATCAPLSGGGVTYTLLKAVRIGTHDGYDRITFEFAPTFASPPPVNTADIVPKYDLQKVAKLVQDGSGNPVQVAGSALYSVVFHGATGYDTSSGTGAPSYTGAREFKRNFPILAELEQTGDFEATLSWGFGLKQLRCPKTFELKSPTRLVIDIPH